MPSPLSFPEMDGVCEEKSYVRGDGSEPLILGQDQVLQHPNARAETPGPCSPWDPEEPKVHIHTPSAPTSL